MNFEDGDSVLVKHKRINKVSSPCSPEIVEKINGSMITAKKQKHEITRSIEAYVT